MSLTEKNKVGANTYELKVHIDADAFEQAVEKSFRKNGKKINVPGFRRGKAPRKMMEKLYGPEVFYEDAVNEVYPSALDDAVKEAELKLVARPSVEVNKVDKESGVDFVAKCVVKPEVSVKDYKGIEVEETVRTASDEDVEKRLDSMRNRNARLVDANRASEKGDTMVFDFDGSVDGKAFEGGKAEKYSLEIGSNQFIPGFEEQLENRNIGDEFDVTVTFPEDYQAEDLKGREAVFKCKVHEIKKKELPELDDEFAKDVSEFDTLEELKADIRKKMQEQLDKTSSNEVEDKIIEQIIANMEAEVPHEMIDTRIDEMARDFEYRLQSQGLTLDAYLQYSGLTAESFRQTFEEQAAKQVKIRLALEKIVELEKIVPTEEEIEAEYQKAAENYKMDVEKIKQLVPHEAFVEDLAVNKAIDFVKEQAKITKVDEKKEAPEPKPKKPAKAEGNSEKPAEKKPARKTSSAKKTAAAKEEK